jgi:hypothetical protein
MRHKFGAQLSCVVQSIMQSERAAIFKRVLGVNGVVSMPCLMDELSIDHCGLCLIAMFA